VPVSKPVSELSEASVVTTAALRAADRLDLTSKVLARLIGVSEATVSRMRSGGYRLQPGQKAFELAVLFARLYRSLDAVVGGEDAVARAWLKNFNMALAGEPIALIQTVPGLVNVIAYLDARRAVL
jgi:hypothetical protein